MRNWDLTTRSGLTTELCWLVLCKSDFTLPVIECKLWSSEGCPSGNPLLKSRALLFFAVFISLPFVF